MPLCHPAALLSHPCKSGTSSPPTHPQFMSSSSIFDIVLRTYGRFAPLRPCRKPNLKIVQRKLCNAFIIVAIRSQFCHQVLKFWFYPQIKLAPTINITTRSVDLGKDGTINIGQANLCMLYVDIAPNARLPGKLHLRQIAINNWWRLIVLRDLYISHCWGFLLNSSAVIKTLWWWPWCFWG